MGHFGDFLIKNYPSLYIKIYIDKSNISVARIKMIESSDDYTSINFINRKLNQQIEIPSVSMTLLDYAPSIGGSGMNSQRYSPEFKDEAVRQIVDRGYSVTDVSKRLGVSGN